MMKNKELKKIVQEARKRLCNAPKGHVRITKKRRGVEYYYKEEGKITCHNKNGRYMRKDEYELAVRIAQKDYDTCVIERAEARMHSIARFLRQYKETDLKQLYEKMNPHRRALITPVVISDEEYINKWLAAEYKGKSFEDDNEIITERGERVRSNSEKIIADKLYMLGIPYRYECPLYLNGNVTVYPDFTILKMPEREEVYLEHFGMLDDAEYVENMIFKLNTYEKNQIYLGVNLFLTQETGRHPINVRALDDMLKKLFC